MKGFAMSMPRLEPIAPPYDDATAAFLSKWMPPGAHVEPLKLFRTMILHPALTERMRPLGAGILGHGTLPPTDRELVIARVCARCGCEYEWGVHVASYGQALGIAPEKLNATVTADASAPIWDAREALLIGLVDELHESAHVSDVLWHDLTQHWDTPQLLELLIVAGFYHTIAYIANGLQIERETWAARFPQATPS
jgi:alkylhydroperoxidase family enzyme